MLSTNQKRNKNHAHQKGYAAVAQEFRYVFVVKMCMRLHQIHADAVRAFLSITTNCCFALLFAIASVYDLHTHCTALNYHISRNSDLCCM